MISGKLPPRVERRLNKHTGTILIGGIFLCFSVMFYLSFCNMQCEDKTYGAKYKDELESPESHGSWKKHIFVPKKGHSASVIVFVLTGPNNIDRRDVIRDTWLKDMPNSVKTKFVIGLKKLSEEDITAIKRENSVHNDLLLLDDLEDSYQKLTEKLLSGFQWVDKKYDFQYLLKVDDDSFVRMDVFLSDLSKKPKSRLYWGFFNGNARVKKSGPWEEQHWVLCDHYLPYARGGGYVLTADLIHYIASNSKFLQKFNSEDVSVGAWLGPLDINRIHDTRFDTEYKSRGCDNRFIVLHKQTTANMRDKYNNLKEFGTLCQKEKHVRLSYNYNWNVLPSLCCVRNDSSIP